MAYKTIPGFDKFEIDENGEVRNVKTKRVTAPYHTSDKTGPMIHLLDNKAPAEARLSVLKLVWELFGTKVKGWDIDPTQIVIKASVERKPRLTDAERQARDDAKEAARLDRQTKRDAAKKARDDAKEAAKAAKAAASVKVPPVSASVKSDAPAEAGASA